MKTIEETLSDFVAGLPIKATEIGWEKIGEDIQDTTALLSQLIDQARLEELKNLRLMEFENGADDFTYYDVDSVNLRIAELQNRLTKGESDG